MSSDLSVVPMSSEKSNVDETNTSFGSDMSVRSVQSDTRRRQLNPRPGLFILIMNSDHRLKETLQD